MESYFTSVIIITDARILSMIYTKNRLNVFEEIVKKTKICTKKSTWKIRNTYEKNLKIRICLFKAQLMTFSGFNFQKSQEHAPKEGKWACHCSQCICRLSAGMLSILNKVYLSNNYLEQNTCFQSKWIFSIFQSTRQIQWARLKNH